MRALLPWIICATLLVMPPAFHALYLAAKRDEEMRTKCDAIPGQQLLDSTRRTDGSLTCRYLIVGRR